MGGWRGKTPWRAAYRRLGPALEAARRRLGSVLEEARRRLRPALGEARRRLAAAAALWIGWVRREYRGLSIGRAAGRIRREILLNPERWRAVYVLIVTAWFAAIVWGRLLAPLAVTPYAARPALGFQVYGYFENGAGGPFMDSLPTLRDKVRLFDAVLPFWYSVAADGSLAGDAYRSEVVKAARAAGLKIVPVVTNAKEGDPSAEVLTQPEARRRAIETLAGLAVEHDFDGLNIIFSLLPGDVREAYTGFITELASALHARGRVLWVTVVPDVELAETVHAFLDYAALGRAADLIFLTAYDRHWTATGPGPISPTGWVETSLDRLLAHVPARKVVLSVGTHAYDWPDDPRRGLTQYLPTRTALERARESDAEVRLDADSGQSYFDYRGQEGEGRRVWLQDARHLAEKAELARRRGLRGIAVWRLGFSEDGALEELAHVLGRRT